MPFTHQGLQRSFQKAGRREEKKLQVRVIYNVCDVVLEQL